MCVGEEVRLADCKKKLSYFVGRKPVGHRHHHCFSPHQLGRNPTTQRTICRRRSGMCEGPKNGRAQILSIQGAAAWSFLALKEGRWSEDTAVFIRQLAKARARQSFHTCTKWSRLPSSPDGPHSLLMPPSPPLPQASQSEHTSSYNNLDYRKQTMPVEFASPRRTPALS